MARIPDYPAATPLAGTEQIPVWQGGQQVQTPVSAIVGLGSAPGPQGNPGGNIMAIGLFTIAATLAIPTGTNLVKTSGYSADGRGSAEYVYDATVDSTYVAANPKTSFVSSNGRGFKLSLDQGVNVDMFGAVGNWVSALSPGTDDSAAFAAARNWSQANAIGLATYYEAGPAIHVPGRWYYQGTTTFEPNHTFALLGSASIAKSDIISHSRMIWADGATGIRPQRYNTSGPATTDGTTHTGGDGFTIRNIRLTGGYAGTEGEYHGIHGRARFIAENVDIDGFSGDGVMSDADDGGSSGIAGNSNGSRLVGVTVSGCRNGLSKTGGNSNAWTIIDFETISNRQFGRKDLSFLSSVYIGGQDAGNGLVPGTASSVVSNGGNRYAVVYGQEPAASTTAPTGTADTSIWYYLGAGGVNTSLNIQAWVSGMTLRAGGAGLIQNYNAQTVVSGNYTEGGEGPLQGTYPAMVLGGQQAAGVKGSIGWLKNLNGSFISTSGIGAADPVSGLANTLTTQGLNLQDPAMNSDYETRWYNGDLYEATLNSVPGNLSLSASRWTGRNTASNLGQYRRDFLNGFGFAALKRFPGTAAPTSGTYVRGDEIWQTAPVSGGVLKWFASAGGTPGTWNADYHYPRADPAIGIGYVTGAGGAITQATSRTTGVTLGTVSGQITLFSKATTAGEVDTFTLTNASITSKDTLSMSLSGTLTGTYLLSAVIPPAGGSAQISVYTPAAVGSAEAPVINFNIIRGANS